MPFCEAWGTPVQDSHCSQDTCSLSSSHPLPPCNIRPSSYRREGPGTGSERNDLYDAPPGCCLSAKAWLEEHRSQEAKLCFDLRGTSASCFKGNSHRKCSYSPHPNKVLHSGQSLHPLAAHSPSSLGPQGASPANSPQEMEMLFRPPRQLLKPRSQALPFSPRLAPSSFSCLFPPPVVAPCRRGLADSPTHGTQRRSCG